MPKTIEAFLREDGALRLIAITGAAKPEIGDAVIERWQRLFDLIAREVRESVALILRITEDSIRILLRSDKAELNGTEYYLGGGLYCQSVTGNSGLLVKNNAPALYIGGHTVVKPPLFACVGLPLQWPDEELFGIVCMPNHATKALKKIYSEIFTELKAAFEQELAFVYQQKVLVQTAETDPLTQIYNRRKIDSILKAEFERAKRYGSLFSVTIMDLNSFKMINDVYGHDAGDEILKAFVDSLSAKLRETDVLGRWGGDEFILVCPHTDVTQTRQMLARIMPAVKRDMDEMPAFSGFCFGVAQYEFLDQSCQVIIKRADEKMYEQKKQRQREGQPHRLTL